MNAGDFMDEARQVAAQCWCDETTSHLTMIPELAEAVARRIAVWMADATREAGNSQFYRDLLDRCAAAIGPAAYVNDAGESCESPIRLKIPELVERVFRGNKERGRFVAELAEFLVGQQVRDGISLQRADDAGRYAQRWSRLRSTVPGIFGYPTVAEAERLLREFLCLPAEPAPPEPTPNSPT
jgi:hypothetical protein